MCSALTAHSIIAHSIITAHSIRLDIASTIGYIHGAQNAHIPYITALQVHCGLPSLGGYICNISI